MVDLATVSWGAFFWIIAAFALAMWSIASALAGFDRGRLPYWERILRICLGLLVLVPNVTIAGAAAVLTLADLAFHAMRHRSPAAAPNPSQ
jgi:TRAP-type uncharacterized transport system fused permease subunit